MKIINAKPRPALCNVSQDANISIGIDRENLNNISSIIKLVLSTKYLERRHCGEGGCEGFFYKELSKSLKVVEPLLNITQIYGVCRKGSHLDLVKSYNRRKKKKLWSQLLAGI